MPRMAAAVAFAAVLSLVACSQQASQPATPPVAATPVPQPQAARELDMYRKLLAEKSYELAAPIGEEIATRFPGSGAAQEVGATLADVRAKADASARERRLSRLWSYQSGRESGGDQVTASIYANEQPGVDRVRLVLRRHSAWGQSVYLFAGGKGFACKGICTIPARFDDHAVALKAYLPETGEPAIFIKDDAGFIARLAKTRKLSLDVDLKDAGRKTLVFDVGGFDPAKFPPLKKVKG